MNTIFRQLRRYVGRWAKKIPYVRHQLLISSDYRVVTEAEASRNRGAGWLRNLTARRQERAYEFLLKALRAGDPRIDFKVAAEAVEASGIANPNILEIGCGNGYYAEVFQTLLMGPFRYTGLDYSPHMVESAKRLYPGYSFRQGDATKLDIADGAFDIAFNGVSLMHIMDYGKAIAEAARVSSKACIFHSVPVFQDRATTYLRKYAYGAPVSEIVFNESELRVIFERNGMKVLRAWDSIPYDVDGVVDEQSSAKTFLCVPV